MNRNNTAGITDQILQDFFNDENLKIAHNRKRALRPAVLQSIYTSSNETKGTTNIRTSQSTSNIRAKAHQPKPRPQNVHNKHSDEIRHPEPVSHPNEALTSPKPPLKIDDYNRISDLMHRVSSVSGHSPLKGDKVDVHSFQTNSDMARNMKEVQLQAMRDSEALKEIMNCVVHCYDELQEVITSHLTYRTEVATQVQDINRTFIELFEQMLKQVLLTQRTKFKTQTATIEEQNHEIVRLQNLLAVDTEHIARLQAENGELRHNIAKIEDEACVMQGEINVLTHRLTKLEADEKARKESSEDISRDAKEMMKRALQDLKVSHAGIVENLRYHHLEDMHALQFKYDKLFAEHEKMSKRLTEAENKTSLFQKDANDIIFKRPSKDNSTQTQITSDGLWDKQDGWILPVSQTVVARNHWRQVLNFAHCPSCKGVGKYIVKVAAVFKAISRGKELVASTHHMHDYYCKWALPDAYMKFLSNLPKTLLAMSPKTMQWIIRIVTHLLNFKNVVDGEDSSLGYNLQPFNEYIVETFLMRLENRSDAEIGIYKLLITLREHYRKHSLLMLFARLLGIVDTPSVAEREVFKREEALNEAALKRKRDSEMEGLKPRLRAKILQHIRHEKAVINESAVTNTHYETHFARNYKALDLDILTIYLYARQCLMYNNYSGVYAKRIKDIKAKSMTLAMAQNALLGNLTHQTSTDLLHQDQIFTVEQGDIPDHLCVGETGVNWIPLDRAIRVVKVFTTSLSHDNLQAVYHSIENHAVFLTHEGKLELPEGMHTLIRKVARLFTYSKSEDCSDISWFTAYQTYENNPINGEHGDAPVGGEHEAAVSQSESIKGGASVSNNDKSSKTTAGASSKHKLEKSSTSSRFSVNTSTAKNKHHLDDHSAFGPGNKDTKEQLVKEKKHRLVEIKGGVMLDLDRDSVGVQRYYDAQHPDTVMVNMDHLLQLIVDTMLIKEGELATKLKAVFSEGDVNGDGVLSFQEFLSIASKAAPDFNKRKILKMYREALSIGDDSDSIGPDAFIAVCKAYGLIKLLDIDDLRRTKLKGVSDPPVTMERRTAAPSTQNSSNAPSRKNSSAAASLKRVSAIHRRSDVHVTGPQLRQLQNIEEGTPLLCPASHKVTFGGNSPQHHHADSESDSGDEERGEDGAPLQIIPVKVPMVHRHSLANIRRHEHDEGHMNFGDSFLVEGLGSNYVSPVHSRMNSPRQLSAIQVPNTVGVLKRRNSHRPPAPSDFSKLAVVSGKSYASGLLAGGEGGESTPHHTPVSSHTPTTNNIMRVSVKTKQQLKAEEDEERERLLHVAAETASSQAHKKTLVRPEDIAKLLAEQHQSALKGVDTKALVQNEVASKSSAETMMAQLKLRREQRAGQK